MIWLFILIFSGSAIVVITAAAAEINKQIVDALFYMFIVASISMCFAMFFEFWKEEERRENRKRWPYNYER